MSITRTLGRVGTAVAAALALVPAVVANADSESLNEPYLAGRAVLPVETYAAGPPAGAFFGNVVINGISFPTPSQPVEGFSAIVSGRRPGEYLAMPDNGFGSKLNSRDFLIRAYYVRPDFKTPRGGSGTVAVGDFIQFSDPNGLIGFPIVNEGQPGRLLTGGDIDPESLQRGRSGEFWVGDEFGPWILHFDAAGRLLDAPFAMPDGLVSPNNPGLVGPATQPNSRGIEAMAISRNGKSLHVILEGASVGDPADERRIYTFDTVAEAFVPQIGTYRTEAAGHFVADVQALDGNRLAVVERDGGLGVNAVFRRVYAIDLRQAPGALTKTQLVDLAAIPDPAGVSLPEIHAGDVGLGDPFRVTCESVEALMVLSDAELLVGCDNNFPNKGRNPGLADDNEFIVIEAPDL